MISTLVNKYIHTYIHTYTHTYSCVYTCAHSYILLYTRPRQRYIESQDFFLIVLILAMLIAPASGASGGVMDCKID